MKTTTVSQEVKSEFLRLVDKTKEFYLSNPTSELKTWIFLTAEDEIRAIRSRSAELQALEYPASKSGVDLTQWRLVAILGNDTPGFYGRLKAETNELLCDLAEACEKPVSKRYYKRPAHQLRA